MTIAKNVFMVLDTETADFNGSVYDVGYVICNKRGEIVVERNWLVKEVFTDGSAMMGAFYAKKLFSHYAPMLEAGEIKITPWIEIIATMNADIRDYGVTVICAYNAGFDFRVMRNTHKQLGFSGAVLEQGLQTLDLWRFACETKLSQKQYRIIAESQGWISEAGNLRSGAEYAYRFCSGDFGFIEDHTALSDARIEAQIMAECFRMKKRVPYGEINGQPWRIIQAA